MRNFVSTREKAIRSDDLIHQPEAQSFLRSEYAGGEQQVARVLLADLPDEEVGNDSGNKSDADFRVSELCFLSSQSEIADSCNTGASCYGRAVYRRYSRRREVVNRAEQPCHGARVFQALFFGASDQRLQVLQIHTRAERFAGSSDDQDLSSGVAHRLESLLEVGNQFVADGVAFVGTIERQQGDAIALAQQDCLEVH